MKPTNTYGADDPAKPKPFAGGREKKPATLTRAEASETLRGFMRELRIDPRDACNIFDEVGEAGIDRETLGDYLDGAGYPELASEVYGGAAA